MADTPPAALTDLAAACVRYVHKTLGIELDFTPETLPLLDHYLRDLKAPPTTEITALIAPAAGAYFGEVVRRTLGPVRWHTEGEDYAGYRIEFERCFLYFNPVGQALEAITREPAGQYGSNLGVRAEDSAAVKVALERLGDVRDDDYYRLATRYEVVEAVVATLAAQMLAAGESERRFTPDEYAQVVADVQAAEARGGLPN